MLGLVALASPDALAQAPCPRVHLALNYADSTTVSLNDEQLASIQAAIALMRQCPIHRVEISPVSPDLPLWERRAEALRAEFARQAIPEDKIDIGLTPPSGLIPAGSAPDALAIVVWWSN